MLPNEHGHPSITALVEPMLITGGFDKWFVTEKAITLRKDDRTLLIGTSLPFPYNDDELDTDVED